MYTSAVMSIVAECPLYENFRFCVRWLDLKDMSCSYMLAYEGLNVDLCDYF